MTRTLAGLQGRIQSVIGYLATPKKISKELKIEKIYLSSGIFFGNRFRSFHSWQLNQANA